MDEKELKVLLLKDEEKVAATKARLLAETNKTYLINLKSPNQDLGVWTIRGWNYGEIQQIISQPYFIKAAAVLFDKMEWTPTEQDIKDWFKFQCDMIAKAVIDPPIDGDYILKLNSFKALSGLWQVLLKVSGMTDEDLGFLDEFFRKP